MTFCDFEPPAADKAESNTVPLFTIIVPVFNVEPYLRRCLDSIASQTLRDIEVIIVNDGSTDRSAAICKDFCDRHKNFRFYEKQNEGQGVARNFGLARAKGNYILFVDSDDYIESTLCEDAREWMGVDTFDFVNFGLNFVDESGRKLRGFGQFRQEAMSGAIIFRHAMLDDQVLSSPVNKVYRRDFLQAHDIRFPATRSAEDTHFSRALAMFATKTRFVSRVYYYALTRPNSTTRGLRQAFVDETIEMLENGIDYFRRHSLDPDVEALYGAHFCKLTSYLLVQAAFRAKDYSMYLKCCRRAQQSSFARYSRNAACVRLLKPKSRLLLELAKRPFLLRWSTQLAVRLGVVPY